MQILIKHANLISQSKYHWNENGLASVINAWQDQVWEYS